MPEEQWEAVPQYEGRYEVSTLGRVRSFLFSREGRLMKLQPYSNGYVRAQFQFGEKWLLHRLVATVFLPNPENLPAVNHKDGNKANNAVSNLEWVTYSDNMRHSWRDPSHYRNRKTSLPRGERHTSAKLTVAQVKEIRERYARKEMGSHRLAKEYGVTKPAIRSVIHRRTWAHV